MATDAQIAVHQGRRSLVLISDVCGAPLRWPSQELTKLATVLQIASAGKRKRSEEKEVRGRREGEEAGGGDEAMR